MRAWAALVVAFALPMRAQAATRQQAPEEAAFEAAREQVQPAARVEALQSFLQRFPSASRRGTAQQLLLETYLASFPSRTEQIHAVASAQLADSAAGFDRWTEEARLAGLLAEAGADLNDAEHWAQDALHSLTEESYRHEMIAAQIRYKLPRLPQKQLHAQYLEYRATFLGAMASVDLAQGHPAEAMPLLNEAFRLEPLSGKINSLQGQLFLAQDNDAAALASLERADAMGGLSARERQQEFELFSRLEHGTPEALERQVDLVYQHLYPPLFHLPPRQLAPGGHAVLLELFTGSGCLPCAAPDLAIDSLLGSYTRNDLIVLAYDEHIPRPDPLTAPDGVARAAEYGVAATPAAFIDGQPVDVLGGARADVENTVVDLGDVIESVAGLPSGLQLTMDASMEEGGTVIARPALTVHPLPTSAAGETTGDTSIRRLARAMLHVALVQDDVRYSGENGVRVHRMVVRALQQRPAAAFFASPPPEPFHFDLPALNREQTAYLSTFETENDRFGSFHFATTHLPIEAGKLAVVVWVQDPATKRVLQAAYAAVPAR